MLFVIGAPRSGTTLARTLLGGFKGLYLPPDEFQILPNFIAQASQSPDVQALIQLVSGSVFAGHMKRREIWPDPAPLKAALGQTPPSAAFEALIHEIAKKDGAGDAHVLGDKTPETVFELPLIQRTWPKARFIEVVRDPRSTVLSMHRAWGRSILRSSVIWRDALHATAAFRANEDQNRIYRLSFEALTEDPAAEMAQLADWLELPYDNDFLGSARSEERWGKAAGQQGVQKRAAEWGGALTVKQIKQIEEISFRAMKQAGYEPQYASHEAPPSPAALKLAKVGDAVRVLQAYARERGWPAAIRYKLRQWVHRRRPNS